MADPPDRTERASEEVLAQFLKTGTGEGGVEVDTLKNRVDFDGGGCSGEGPLSTLTCGTVDEPIIEMLAPQVGVTGGGLDLGDTFLDGQEGNIESSSTEIEDEDIATLM